MATDIYTYKCQKPPGTIGPNDPCKDDSECIVDYVCATGTVVDFIPPDEEKKRKEQKRINKVGKTCQLRISCETVQTIDGILIFVRCP